MAFGPTLAAPIGATGPDDFGYQGDDIAYNLRNIRSSGKRLRLREDQVSRGIGIGFGFSFYGNTYSTAYISSNGFITFSRRQSHGCCAGARIPDAAGPNNLIAGWWEDLDPSEGRGRVRYQTLGEAGSREFVVGFYNVEHWPYGNPVSFEIILHEGSNDIEFQWAAARTDGSMHTVGIENADGSDGLLLLQSSRARLRTGYCVGEGGCGASEPGTPTDPGSSTLPEPGTVALLGLGLVGLVALRRRSHAGRSSSTCRLRSTA